MKATIRVRYRDGREEVQVIEFYPKKYQRVLDALGEVFKQRNDNVLTWTLLGVKD